jgi:hypothetical protein
LKTHTVTLQLTANTDARLRILAGQAGKTLEAYLAELTEIAIRQANGSLVEPTPSLWEHSPEERVAAWQAWVDRHPALATVADDSRESIYAGRDE